MFLRHVPAKYKDEAPVVVTDDKGVDQWLYQGRPQGAHRGRCGSCANALVDVIDAGPHLGESGGSRPHSSAGQDTTALSPLTPKSNSKRPKSSRLTEEDLHRHRRAVQDRKPRCFSGILDGRLIGSDNTADPRRRR